MDLVVLNFSDQPQFFEKGAKAYDVLISTYLDRAQRENDGIVRLRANEGTVMAAA
jgi:hypothetical protein